MNKFILLGAGRWGKNYIKTINDIDDCEISYIYDNRDLLSLTDELSDIVGNGTKIINELPEDNKNIDFAIIATPTSTHLEYISKMIKLGVKNILCEKPMCSSLPEANFIKMYVKEVGVNLFVGHTYLAHNAVRYIKNILDYGEVGNIKYISSERLNFGPVRNDMNAVLDLAVHDISIFNDYFKMKPEVISVYGYDIKNRGVEDIVNIMLKYGDVDVHIKAGWVYSEKTRSINIIGDDGIINFNEMNKNQLTVYKRTLKEDENGNYYGLDSARYIADVSGDMPLKTQIKEFVNSKKGNIDFSYEIIETIQEVNSKLKEKK